VVSSSSSSSYESSNEDESETQNNLSYSFDDTLKVEPALSHHQNDQEVPNSLNAEDKNSEHPFK
jgi:hypothetical protein